MRSRRCGDYLGREIARKTMPASVFWHITRIEVSANADKISFAERRPRRRNGLSRQNIGVAGAFIRHGDK